MIHRNPVLIEVGSESAAQSNIHRKTVVIGFGSESAASLLSIEIQSTLNSVRRPTGSPRDSLCSIEIHSRSSRSSNSGPSHRPCPSIIHRKTVVIEFGSEPAAQSILHPKPVTGTVVIEHIISSSEVSKFRLGRHPFRVAKWPRLSAAQTNRCC